MRTLGHVPALDALRGIAILLVLGFHVGRVLPGGWLGVDLFFVLSGFLITSLLIGEWGSSGRISLGAFYRRRVLRLFPALFLMLAVLLVLGESAMGVGYVLTYVTNLVLAFGGDVPDRFQHLWSVAAEEQFYLVWPPVLVLALRRRVRPHVLAGALALLVLACLSWRAFLVGAGASHLRIGAGPDTHVDPILIGCLAGIMFSFGLVRRIPAWIPMAALVPAAAFVATLETTELRAYGGLAITLFAAACALVLLASVLEPRWWFVRIIDQRPLRYLGKISYGLYLWHMPILQVSARPAVGLALSIAVAALSYRYIERPFLRMKRRRGEPAASKPAALPAAA